MVQKVPESFCADSLRLYPDPEAAELTEALASYCQVDREQVFVGVGSKKLIGYLNDVKFSFHSYTMNRVTMIACGKACVEADDYFRKTVQKIVETREWTKTRWNGWPDFWRIM